MENISRINLDKICQILKEDVKTEEAINLAKKLNDFDFIPKMYVYTFLKRFYKEIKEVNTGTIEDLDMEMLYGLSLEIVTKSNLNGFKELLRIAFERENYICDFDDTKNSNKMFGVCQNEDHDNEDNPEQEITLVLMPDEDNKKFDDNSPEYWCSDCCESTEPDVEVSCDMDIGEMN